MSRVVYFKDRGRYRKPRFWRVVQEGWKFYDEWSSNRRTWRREK